MFKLFLLGGDLSLNMERNKFLVVILGFEIFFPGIPAIFKSLFKLFDF